MPYIKQISIPNGDGSSTTYDIRDQQAWEQLIQKLDKKVVQSLPPKPGTPGVTYTEDEINELLRTIYLIKDQDASQSGQNAYFEYVLINAGTQESPTYEWEKLGTTETDLSGYSLSGHVHQVTPQTRVADHNFTVGGTLPDLQFTGSPSNVSGDVTLDNGDVTINIEPGSAEGSGTSYVPSVVLSGRTESGGQNHGHTFKKNTRYLERTTIIGVSETNQQETVMAHPSTYNDETIDRIVRLKDSATLHSHSIPQLDRASLTGELDIGDNIATNGTLEELSSGNEGNAVFHSASVTDGVLSFGLKQLKHNVSAVTGIGTLSTDACKQAGNIDLFSVYHPSDYEYKTIKNWDLEEKSLSIPSAASQGTVVATGKLTDTSTYGSTNNDPVVADVLNGNASNPSTGTTAEVTTSQADTAHFHVLNSASGNANVVGNAVKFSGSLESGSGTMEGTVTPNGSVSYYGGSSWQSDNVVLSHTVYNPMVFTSPDTNEANNTNNWYGITYNENDADPDKSFGRIGNMSMHALLPVQSKMVRCLLNSDGTVNYYLDPNDSTKKYNGTYNGVTSDGSNADLSGNDGNVMVEVPEHWYYVTKDHNGQVTAMLSPVAQTGWVHIPKYYVGAYESCGSSSKMTSVSGANPYKATSLATLRSSARANGSSGQYKWNAYPYFIHVDLYWLYVIEYANTNSQAPVDDTLLEGKYRQGGLGDGCTATLTLTNNAPATVSGNTNSLGNASGEVIIDNNGTSVKMCSYRGIENIFGHVFKAVDGIMINVTDGGETKEAFVCTDPSKFSSTSTANYTSLGGMSTAIGYIKKMLIGEDGRGWTLSSYSGGTGASSTAYYCDKNVYVHQNNALKMVWVGGTCESTGGSTATNSRGSQAGLASLAYSFSVTTTESIGSRLVFYDNSQE